MLLIKRDALMNIENINSMLKANYRNKVKFRDGYNFIVWGLCLSKELNKDDSGYYIFVDSLTNKVYINYIIEIKSL